MFVYNYNIIQITNQIKSNQIKSKMWYLKKATQSVWNASKNLVDKRTPIQKLIDSIAQCQQQILPTNKLSQLSSQTYEVEKFDEIVDVIYDKLKKFNYDLEESHKTLNILVATHYIIKHGATGFVDQFRKFIGMFQKYEKLKQKPVYEDKLSQARLDDNLQKIQSRAHYISQLLSNKQKLLKQKQLSMLVKQKLKLYQKNKLSQLKKQQYSNAAQRSNQKQIRNQDQSERQTSSSNIQSQAKKLGNRAQQIFNHPQQISNKLEGILQTYLWKYVDKLDQTIETASDKVLQQIDKYVLGYQQPSVPFQLEQDEQKMAQKDDSGKKIQNEEDQLMQKLEDQVKDVNVQNVNLLDFEEVQTQTKQPSKKEEIVEDLI